MKRDTFNLFNTSTVTPAAKKDKITTSKRGEKYTSPAESSWGKGLFIFHAFRKTCHVRIKVFTPIHTFLHFSRCLF